jgi:hypothetical protein
LRIESKFQKEVTSKYSTRSHKIIIKIAKNMRPGKEKIYRTSDRNN